MWTRKRSIFFNLAHVARKNIKKKVKQTNASAPTNASLASRVTFSPYDVLVLDVDEKVVSENVESKFDKVVRR